MNIVDIKSMAASGESERLEFKRSSGQRSEATKSVCGMLNGIGGHVLFGVADNGTITGQHVSARTLEDIAAELRRIEPPAFPDIEVVNFENGMAVLVLTVTGRGGLYLYDGRPYLRQGPTTIIMPREEYERKVVERLHTTRRWETSLPIAISIFPIWTNARFGIPWTRLFDLGAWRALCAGILSRYYLDSN